MKIHQKRRVILDMARKSETITKKQVVKALGYTYYANASKHLGDILSRMVNSGLLHRLKPGIFKLKSFTSDKIKTDNPNQQKLF